MPYDYHAVRMAHTRRMLWAGLRRWGLGLGAVLVMLAAASNAPLAVVAGILSALALPVWDSGMALAASTGLPALADGLCRVLVMALVAALPVTVSRRVWWPRHWAEQERAWPLPRATIRQSDLRLAAAFVAAPVLLSGIGWLVLAKPSATRSSPAAAASTASGAALAWSAAGLLLAALGALALAWGWMQWVRARAGRSPGPARHQPAHRAVRCGAGIMARRHWAWALLATPLWRGVARGTARVLILATVATPALAAGPLVSVHGHGPGLAALATLAVACTVVLRQRTALEWAPMAAAMVPLPLAPARLARSLWALGLWPAAWAAAWGAAALAYSGARALPSLIFMLLLAATCALEARSKAHQVESPAGVEPPPLVTPAPDDPVGRAAWRLLALCLLAALAWETAPR